MPLRSLRFALALILPTAACAGSQDEADDAAADAGTEGSDDGAATGADATDDADDARGDEDDESTGALPGDDDTGGDPTGDDDPDDGPDDGLDDDPDTDDDGGDTTSDPVEPSAITDISAGNYHTCAVLDTGAVRCWGWNFAGALGYANDAHVGDDEDPADAGDVDLGGLAVEVGAGSQFTCARLVDGDVRCWGISGFGQLGLGPSGNVGDDETPAAVEPVDIGGEAIDLSVGIEHSCVVLDGGSVRCWGESANGRLGYGSLIFDDVGDDESPADVGDVDVGGVATAVETGRRHTCVILEGGAVRCWGSNTFGQLGYPGVDTLGDDEAPSTAGDVDVGGPVVALSLGSLHTCALLEGGDVRCWGWSFNGLLGVPGGTSVGSEAPPSSAPLVDLGGPAVALAGGPLHTCALRDDGNVLCWGEGFEGQLGYGNVDPVGDDETPNTAGPVALGADAIEISAGLEHTCARLDTGGVRCWGANRTNDSTQDNRPGRLGYPGVDYLGDDELPTAVGEVEVF